jgi:hypothetical protein
MPRRSIDTKMWVDNWFGSLDPIERYLFQYFMTNEHTELCGYYELPLRVMAFETGLDMEMLNKIIKRFAADKKVFYHEGWIWVVNYEEHQVVNTSMKVNAIRSKEKVPYGILRYFETLGGDSVDTVSTQGRHIKHKDRDKDKDKRGSGGDLYRHIDYLKDVPEDDLKEFSSKLNCSPSQIRGKAEDLLNYCRAKGRTYKDYKAFLRNALKKDYGERIAEKPKPKLPEISPEQIKKNLGALAKMKENFKSMPKIEEYL